MPCLTGAMNAFPENDRNRPHRHRERVAYDRQLVHGILDEALVCHVGLDSGGPLVLPMIHARAGDALYLHASTGAGLAMTELPADVCVTVTLVDGVVLAKSWFDHSLNYRSVVIRGRADAVVDPVEKESALAALMEHVSPGRSGTSRPPTRRELAATAVLRVGLDSVAAKVRSGGPADDPADAGLPHWTGVVPLRVAAARAPARRRSGRQYGAAPGSPVLRVGHPPPTAAPPTAAPPNRRSFTAPAGGSAPVRRPRRSGSVRSASPGTSPRRPGRRAHRPSPPARRGPPRC